MRTEIQYQQPGELRQHAFNFAAQVELADAGDSLTGTPSLTITRLSGSGTLAPGATSISTTFVNFTLSGGADGDRHRIVCTVSTVSGRVLQSTGELRIQYST